MAKRTSNSVGEERSGFHGRPASGSSEEDERDWGDDWVHKLIAMTRPGVEIRFPSRALSDRPIPFEYDDFS